MHLLSVGLFLLNLATLWCADWCLLIYDKQNFAKPLLELLDVFAHFFWSDFCLEHLAKIKLWVEEYEAPYFIFALLVYVVRSVGVLHKHELLSYR